MHSTTNGHVTTTNGQSTNGHLPTTIHRLPLEVWQANNRVHAYHRLNLNDLALIRAALEHQRATAPDTEAVNDLIRKLDRGDDLLPMDFVCHGLDLLEEEHRPDCLAAAASVIGRHLSAINNRLFEALTGERAGGSRKIERPRRQRGRQRGRQRRAG